MSASPIAPHGRSISPFELRLERRLEVPRWMPLAATIGAVILALVIGGVIIAVVGGDPVRAYAHIMQAAFGSIGVISDTLVVATPLILTGLACAVAFRMRLWNIGAEGQLLMGAWGAGAVVLLPVLPADAPPILFLFTMAVAGMAFGALWGFIPGVLKARLGVNEIIVTLMLNYVAALWIDFWVFGAWSEGGFQLSAQFPKAAWLPRLTDLADAIKGLSGLTIHLGFIIAVIVAVALWYVLKRSRWGYEIRLIGDSPAAARYAGIDIARNTILVFMLSGALAGLAGMIEVSGAIHRMQQGISPGYGFTAIIVAYIAKFNPLGVVVAAILFAALILAGREIQPAGVPAMIQGIILFCLIGSDIVVRYSVRFVRRRAA